MCKFEPSLNKTMPISRGVKASRGVSSSHFSPSWSFLHGRRGSFYRVRDRTGFQTCTCAPPLDLVCGLSMKSRGTDGLLCPSLVPAAR